MMTPLRRWIKKTLISKVPTGGIWSNTHAAAFEDLTGISHQGLLKKWFGNKLEEPAFEPDYGKQGPDPRFTTCSSFLPRFATQVRRTGNLPTMRRNYYTGKDVAIGLRGFQLQTERGWTPAFLGYAVAGGPQEGDFVQLGHNGMTKHVGIIVKIQDDRWSLAAGGAGGRMTRRDGVKRTPLEPRPANVMGWIDVDVYFEGWSGPDVGEVRDDY